MERVCENVANVTKQIIDQMEEAKKQIKAQIKKFDDERKNYWEVELGKKIDGNI